MKKLHSFVLWCLFLALLFTSSLAYAQPNSTRVYKIINHATGKALDVDWPGWGHYYPYFPVHELDQSNSASQQWKFMASRANGTGVYEVINRSSSMLLTVPDSYPAPQAGSSVNQRNRNTVVNSSWQLWQLKPLPNISPISYQLTLRATGLLLTSEVIPGPRSATQNTAGAGDQVWDLVDVSVNTTANLDLGVYAISNVRSTYLLEGSTINSTRGKVVQNPDAGVAGQEWTFVPASNAGFFRIINRATGWGLEIGGSDLPYLYNQGREADLWDPWGGPNQQWSLLDANTRRVLTLAEARTGIPCILINYHTRQCLEMGGSGTLPVQAGRTPNQWPYAGTDNQVWYIQYRAANRGVATPLATTSPAAEEAGLGLFPNPAQNVVTLTLPKGAAVASVQVFDVRGADVTGNLYRGQGELDITSLAPGFYSVAANDGTHTYHQKLLKKQ